MPGAPKFPKSTAQPEGAPVGSGKLPLTTTPSAWLTSRLRLGSEKGRLCGLSRRLAQKLADEAEPEWVGRVSRRRNRVSKAEASVTRATAVIAAGMPATSAISPAASAPTT